MIKAKMVPDGDDITLDKVLEVLKKLLAEKAKGSKPQIKK